MAVRQFKGKSRIKVVQMDNLRGLLGIRRMQGQKCMDNGVVQGDKRVEERILFDSVIWLFDHVQMM